MTGSGPPSDRLAPLDHIRARLVRPRGYRRVEELLSADAPAEAVAAVPVTELYGLVKEVGFADALELIALASPDQFRGCMDLDLWERDRIEPEAAKPWLDALLSSGFEHVGQVWAHLDSELTALLLARWTRIYDLSLGEEPPEDDDTPMTKTPDTFFVIAMTGGDEETVALLHRLIEDLYRADPVLARHTIMAAHSEPMAELEEQSYRWRSGRMADLGYVDYYEALEAFRPIDPASVVIGEGSATLAAEPAAEDSPPSELPVPLAERLVGRSFLARALAAVSDPAEAERIETGFVLLTNRVLSALRIGADDRDGIAAGADQVTGTVALGLELLARGDVDRAAGALTSVALLRIHRVGYTATLRLGRLARAMARYAAIAGEPTASIIDALTAPHPLLAGELCDPPVPAPRPFATVHELGRAATALTELALRLAVVSALGIDTKAILEQPEPRPALDDYPRTALVRALGGGELVSAPLDPATLAAYLAARPRGPAAADAALPRMAELLDRAQVTAGRELLAGLVSRWVTELEQLLGGLDPAGKLERRYLQGIIVADC